MEKGFGKKGLPADFDMATTGHISSQLQRVVEATVDGRPLDSKEIRGIESMPNHFIAPRSQHNYRAHVASTTVNGQVLFIHQAPQV